jgi:predicted transcriptional regulator
MNRHHQKLSRRERQIIDVLYEKGCATALEVQESLADPPSYATIRSHLTTLEEKGHVRHEKDGAKFIYFPTVHARTARRSALQHLLKTFFRGSREQAVVALLDVSPLQFSDQELDRLAERIEKIRRDKRR